MQAVLKGKMSQTQFQPFISSSQIPLAHLHCRILLINLKGWHTPAPSAAAEDCIPSIERASCKLPPAIQAESGTE